MIIYFSLAILVGMYFSVKDVAFNSRVIMAYEFNKSKLESNIAKYYDSHVIYNMNEYNRRMAYYDEGIDRLTARKNNVMIVGIILFITLIYINCNV